MINVVDFFAGCGGGAIGLHRNKGFNTVLAIDFLNDEDNDLTIKNAKNSLISEVSLYGRNNKITIENVDNKTVKNIKEKK